MGKVIATHELKVMCRGWASGDLPPDLVPDLGDPTSPVCPQVGWGNEPVHPHQGPRRAAALKHPLFGQHLYLLLETRLVRTALMLQALAARTVLRVASPAMQVGDVVLLGDLLG